jgi:formylglycine-generating enzyme required for sulfatase activity
MEASQQQRRSATGSFAKTLADTQLDFDAIDIVDMLWLAQFIPPGTAGPPKSEQPEPKSEQPEPKSPIGITPSFDLGEPGLNLYSDDQLTPPVQPETISKPGTHFIKGTPFSVPAAPALRTRLDLARSLRPLMRKVPSRTRFDLDEAATVTQIAETAVWMPVVRPNPERWLELDLVVEDSKTTVIWERAIAELNHLVEYQGAFRAVRTWRLSGQAGKVQLFPRWREGSAQAMGESASHPRPHTPRELIDPTGRRLVWLVTDCTSTLWRQDLIYKTLLDWAKGQPIAIVQMFPERLWTRTALRDGHRVRLGALAPGLPSAQLEIEGLPQRLERRRTVDLVTVPIVTLEAGSLLHWARVAAGCGDSRTPGRTFDLDFIRRQAEQGGTARTVRTARATPQRTAAERVALFRATASQPARQLADLMAAAPVNLPVIDLLREAFRGDFEQEIQQSDVAEVLLSGLLRRCDTDEDAVCRYEFWGDGSVNPAERVRDLLLGDASISKSIEVLNGVSAWICRRLDSPSTSFQALLAELPTSKADLRAAALPLATVGLGVLRRLGGEYAEWAHRYDLERKGAIDRRPPGDDDFPPLQDCTYESATITAILDRFDFETATLARQSRRLGLRQDWVITRRRAATWGYTETLSPEHGIGLDMIAIPGGSFKMGAPQGELESESDEQPRHAVTLQPFYLGRYAVTQAQWRVVASYDRIDRDLDPDPSRFKGDNRPVENVSWDDAQEFCQRLSAQTSKPYRLPSEAEWEYACRAGTTTPFHFGETIVPELANYNGNFTYNNGLKGAYREATTEVGSFPGNSWGLHEMHGNLWEWCEDNYHSDYGGAPDDGSAWIGVDREATSRLLRGGSWLYIPQNCRSAYRNHVSRDFRNHDVGFRVCCAPPRILPS